jgi:hypothetical protein
VDETFYAVAVVETSKGTQTIDARPSDALNLALLTGSPILVHPDVLAKADGERSPRFPLDQTEADSDGPAAIVADVQALWARAFARPAVGE